ncbi:Holliday junction branch migration protein RuvA [Candidatus Parcubacteria bacterium]|nr:Holliday junction branch migration protein RuvA [Candidatus Parcubacteria bacterium]
MIAALAGTVRHKDANSVILDVSGVGYRVLVPTDVLLEALPSRPLFLWTHLAVRETSLELFGFTEREALEAFELLITISGIGPKTALGILNVASPATLRQAVGSGDTSYLTRVSGIGKKNAEKIVLELKNKLSPKEGEAPHADAKSEGDAMEALISLGYSERDAREALKRVPKEIRGASDRVKEALRVLSRDA